MLDFLKLKKNYFVGIDFGTSAIKIVELTFKNQKAQLVNYGWVDIGLSPDRDLMGPKALSRDERLKTYLANLLERIDLKSNAAYVSMPGFTGLVTLIEFPNMKREELEKAVQFEAHKYIPTDLEEVSIGWEIVEKHEEGEIVKKTNPQGKIQVLLVAAPNKEVARYESIVRGAKLSVRAVELETFSLARSLVGEDLGTFVIIDVGSRATNIVLVEKGIVKVNRNVDIGGTEITNTVADSMNISKQRAEIMKKEERDLLNSKESSIIMPTLEFVANETLRIITAYKEKNKEGRVDGLILSGGSAKLKGIEDYFTRTVGIHASIGNPWKKIVYDGRLEPAIERIGSAYSVAIGLALRGIEEYKRS
jgi:type IV pilus assembly protein PilM